MRMNEYIKKPIFDRAFDRAFDHPNVKKSEKVGFRSLIQSPFKCYLRAFLMATTYTLFKPQICILNTFHGVVNKKEAFKPPFHLST